VADARARSFLDGRAVRLLELRAATTLTLGDPVNGVAVELEPLESVSREQTLPPGKLSGVLDLGAGFAEERARTRDTATGLVPLRTVTIGRDSSNLVSVKDLLVSRQHAEVRPTEGGRLVLVDLESSNGTFVNGRRVARALLDDLDVITVGRHSFRLVGAQLEEYVDEGLVSFQARGLTVLAEDGRPLLEDISFSLDERSFVAVVGPSGAGKSLLLSALTGFRQADRGTVLYGGRDLYMDYDALRTRIGFVPQDDVVHHPLTVRQALSYAAELRFSSDVGRQEREARVTEVIEELGLTALVDARIARLSGGERRRVCVGLELITRPSLLFLDEPTTGLDPGYERSLMRLLRDLANDGRTVVVVTHSVQSLRLCDRVLFLAPGGRTAYFGPAQLAPAYFERDDFPDVFHDLSTEERDWAGRFSEHRLHRQYVEQRLSEDAPHVSPDARPRRVSNPRGWLAQVWLLTRRYARVVTSDRRNVALLLLQPLVLGLIMLAALPAHELGPPPEGELRLASRAGLVLLVLVLGATWLGASNSIREIVKERAVFRHERAAGQHASAYVTSKVLVLGAITLLQAAILVPLATARQGGPEQGSLLEWPLAELVLGAALAGLAAMGLGLFISSVAGSVDRAITILPVVLIIQMLLAMGGVFPDVVEKPGLEQASKLAGTQWGFAATASTVELDRLQTIDRLAEEMSTFDTADPLPFLRAASGQVQSEPRWSHDWETWVWDAVRLLLLTMAGIAGATLVLRRRGVSA
jgi:ABC-type multidrug transport system ATPase subunit